MMVLSGEACKTVKMAAEDFGFFMGCLPPDVVRAWCKGREVELHSYEMPSWGRSKNDCHAELYR